LLIEVRRLFAPGRLGLLRLRRLARLLFVGWLIGTIPLLIACHVTLLLRLAALSASVDDAR
jgi:hypothetical protein